MGVKKWSATGDYTGTTANLKICMLEVSGTTYTNRIKLMSDLIENDLTGTTAGKMLDATQGKIVNDKVTSHTGNTSNPHNVTAHQVGAYTSGETTTAINNAISGGVSGYVPTTRKVNNKALSTDITLVVGDISGAIDNSTMNTAISTSITTNNTTYVNNAITGSTTGGPYVPTSRTVNNKDLTTNITINAGDVGASPSNHNHALSGLTERSYNSLTDLPTDINNYLPLTGGTVTGDITATNFILSSDKTLKTNIKSIGIIDDNINYKEYEFILSPNDIRYGVIAQELEITHPELVITNSENIKSVKYIDLIIYEINRLKQEIKELKNSIK